MPGTIAITACYRCPLRPVANQPEPITVTVMELLSRLEREAPEAETKEEAVDALVRLLPELRQRKT